MNHDPEIERVAVDVPGHGAVGALTAGQDRHAAPAFIAGGGEAGALMRAHDWGATPLGQAEAWPQPLRTLVGVMLAANQPMFIVWGAGRTLLYNDAYAEILASKHPAALGRDFLDAWSEIRADLLPIVEEAYAGRPVHMDDIMLAMNRRGYTEEAHFAFSYTPVRDETGAVAGMFCPCTETTEQVLAERRRAADTERQRRLFEQAPGFITILRGPDHVFEFANHAYLRLIGGRDLIGRTARDALPEVEGQGFFELLDRVYATGERFVAEQVPISLRSAAGDMEEHHLDFIYEPVIDEAGTVTGIFVEGHNVTDRKRIEERLRSSEERYRQIVEGAEDFAIVTLDDKGIITSWNSGAERMVGYDEEEAIGQPGAIFFSAEDRAAGVPDHEMNLAHTAGRAVNERWHQRKDGGRFWGSGLMMRLDAPGGGYLKIFRDRTAEHDAEAALRESEEQFRAFMQALPNHAWTSPPDGQLDWFNERVYEYSGAAAGELDGEGWAGLVHPNDMTQAASKWAAALASGRDYQTEFRLRRSDGAYRWHLARAVAIRSEDGAIARWIGTNTDIEDQKAAVAALHASEERFEAIANSIDQMVWSTRPDGFHDYYNRRWYEYTGTPEGSTDGDGWAGVFHPDDQERALSMWRRCLETGEPYHIEYRLRHRSGQYRWVLGRAQPVHDAAGAITRWFGTCTDIQEIVEAREVLTRSREELERLVEERTADRDRLWRNSLDLLLIARFDGTIVEVNPAWSALLGWSEAELVGTRFLELIHPDDLPASDAEVEALSDEGRSTMHFENRYRAKDGRWVWLSWVVTSHAGLFHGVARDITDDKAHAVELERAQEQLRQSQKMEAIGQLTGGVAHDFNNLLTVIRGSADLLRRQELSEERRRKYIEAISDTADRAARLTGQLLAFARRQSLKPEIFDAGERVRVICEMIGTVVGAKVEIELNLDDGCYVEADANQFETALLNLAVNARDAMTEEGRLSLTVLAPRSAEGQVAVRVADTGRGIPADQLSQIFEPFFTTKEVGKGTGLGLSQVYGFAKQSGGDVEVESVPGEGTVFTLFLPRADEPVDVGGNLAAVEARLEHRGCVLVVEDNEQVGEFSTELLRELGYDTEWAADAEAALARLEEKPSGYDLVFSDVVMPGMSGLDLAGEIRRRHPRLPVVLTSGYSHVLAQDGTHGHELLRKPYSLEDLAATLAQAMAGGKR